RLRPLGIRQLLLVRDGGVLRGRGRHRCEPRFGRRGVARMSRSRGVLAIFVLSGAAGLVYEVVWARELVLVFGNTTQAVSAILTGFFGGMAVGSILGGRLADR